jgi:hypothetical protein
MDSHEIPLAGGEQLQDLLPVGFGFLGAVEFRHLRGIGAQDAAHRLAGEAQHPGDLALAHSLTVQF